MKIRSAWRSVSTVAVLGSTTYVIGLDLMNALIERESVVLPITKTDCGIKVLRISCDVKKIDACATASGNDKGSSVITGQPRVFVNLVISSTDNPPRSCPTTTTPRAPTNRNVPILLRFSKRFGATMISETQSDESSGSNGSSN